MLCPKCKKQQSLANFIKQDKKTNVVLRNRYCAKCDFSFSTYEKIKKINKRKPRPDKLFMNFRFYLYACIRLVAINQTYIRLYKSLGGEESISRKFDEFGFIKTKAGKSGVYYADKKSHGGGKVFEGMVEKKKATIQNILKGGTYWRYRNHIFKKNQISNEEIKVITDNLHEQDLKKWEKSKKTDIENKLCKMVWNELNNFHKSVSMYIKSKEYNQDFFVNYQIEKQFSPWSLEQTKHLSEIWKEQRTWDFYVNAR